MRKLSAVFSALFAVVLYSGIANALPTFCSITGTVYNATTGKIAPNTPVSFWYQPNTQNISGGIITNPAAPLTVYTGANGSLPTGSGAASLVAGADTYVQVGNDTPQLSYIPTSCGGSSIDLNALLGNPDPPLSPVVTSIALNNTSSLSISVTNPTGIGAATLTISGLVNSAGGGTITFDNSGNIVANGNITAKGGTLFAGVAGSQQGCLQVEGATSGYTNVCAPAVSGNIQLTLPQNVGAAGNLLSTDGASPANLSWVNPLAVGRGGADKLVIVPDTTNPTTTMDVTANAVYMVAPATLTTTYVALFVANNVVVGSQTGSIANKRDQTTAFGANTFYHLYAIGGGGQTAATLSSLVAPPTGPTLPTGYTSWAYLGTFQTDGSGNVLAMKEYGNLVHYNATQASVTSGTATTYTTVPLTAVPAIASEIQFSVQGSTGASGTGALASCAIAIDGGTSAYFTLNWWVDNTGGGGGNAWTFVPNTPLNYKITNAGGTGTVNIYIHGYIVPNNSD